MTTFNTRAIVQCMHCGERFDSIAESMTHPHFASDFVPEAEARTLTPDEKVVRMLDTLAFASTALGTDVSFAVKTALYAALLAAEAGYTPAAAIDAALGVHWDGVEHDLYNQVCERIQEAFRAAAHVEYGEGDGGRFYTNAVNEPPF